jgi:DNA polymerase III alpha subunit (gram-positive type)
MREIYVSTDVESDGPIPGPHSMLSFGSVVYDETGEELGTFSRNLEPLPYATQHSDTMAWWKKHPEEWETCRKNLVGPEQAMKEYVEWVKSIPGRPVFVAYPAGFDFMFIYWYLVRFTGNSPFSFSALDIKSFAMALMQKPYRECSKRNFSRNWIPENVQHTHVAVEDAREQGLMFINMLQESKGRTIA